MKNKRLFFFLFFFNVLIPGQLQAQEKEIDKVEPKKTDLIKQYKTEIKALKDTIEARDLLIGRLKEDIRILGEAESDIRRELDEVMQFRQMFVQRKVEEEMPYLQVPYSKMEQKHLRDVVDLCHKFDDKTLGELASDFSAAFDRKAIYDSFVECVNNPYDQKLIEDLTSKRDFIKQSSNDIQNEEIDAVFTLIESYKESNDLFWKIIKQINDFMADYRQEGTDAGVARDGAEYILKSQKVSSYYKRFAKIPYLDKLFTDYKSELLKNPVSQNEIEVESLKK